MHFAIADALTYTRTPGVTGAGAFSTLALPADVTALPLTIRARPSVVLYKGRCYIVGYFSKNLVITENLEVLGLGIQPPQSAPTLGQGTSSAGSVGNAIGRIAFRHRRLNGNGQSAIVHESSMSAPSSTLAVTGSGRNWTGLPTTSPDARVTHIAGYLSMDGGPFLEAWERDIGAASVQENVLTASLGAVGSSRRGVPPWAKFIEKYHNRLWYAGNPDFPGRLYYSEANEPESVAATNTLDTRDGEAITGLKRAGDQLMVFCAGCTYDVQGYSGAEAGAAADLNMRKVEPSIGCPSHHAIVNIHERLWFPFESGVYLYAGGEFKRIMGDITDFWRDNYRANRSAYENAIAEDDRFWQTYKLVVDDTTRSFYYIGSYKDFDPREGEGQAQPDWTFDVRTRTDTAMGRLTEIGRHLPELYVGSDDGIVRQENVSTNFNDDTDTNLMTMKLATKADYFEDIGGGIGHGKTADYLDVYMQAENNAWTLGLYGGEEGAVDLADSPSWPATVPASASVGFIPKNNHFFRPTGVSGQAIALTIEVASPNGVVFKGWGGAWREGPQARPGAL